MLEKCEEVKKQLEIKITKEKRISAHNEIKNEKSESVKRRNSARFQFYFFFSSFSFCLSFHIKINSNRLYFQSYFSVKSRVLILKKYNRKIGSKFNYKNVIVER